MNFSSSLIAKELAVTHIIIKNRETINPHNI